MSIKTTNIGNVKLKYRLRTQNGRFSATIKI